MTEWCYSRARQTYTLKPPEIAVAATEPETKATPASATFGTMYVAMLSATQVSERISSAMARWITVQRLADSGEGGGRSDLHSRRNHDRAPGDARTQPD